MQISDTCNRSNTRGPTSDLISLKVHHGVGLQSSTMIPTHAPRTSKLLPLSSTFVHARLSCSTFNKEGNSILLNGNGPSIRPPHRHWRWQDHWSLYICEINSPPDSCWEQVARGANLVFRSATSFRLGNYLQSRGFRTRCRQRTPSEWTRAQGEVEITVYKKP